MKEEKVETKIEKKGPAKPKVQAPIEKEAVKKNVVKPAQQAKSVEEPEVNAENAEKLTTQYKNLTVQK